MLKRLYLKVIIDNVINVSFENPAVTKALSSTPKTTGLNGLGVKLKRVK